MRLKEIEARVVRLEATHEANPLAGMSEEQLEYMLTGSMDRIAAEYGGDYAVTAEALRADPDPVSQKVADGILWYIERQRQRAEYDAWCAQTIAEQQARAV